MVFNEIEVPKTNKQVLYRLTNYFDNKIKLANSSQVQSTKTSWRFALLFDELLILISFKLFGTMYTILDW